MRLGKAGEMTPLLLLAAASPTVTNPSSDQVNLGRVEAVLVDYVAGAADCGGGHVRTVSTADPLTAGAMLASRMALAEVEMRFRLAPDGRPLEIGNPERVGTTGATLNTPDLPAALSLWRFASSGRERGCTIRFTPRRQPIATAPMDAVYRFATLSREGEAGMREAVARIRAVDCVGKAAPTVLLRGYPDYPKLPPVPGAPAFSVVAFDIDTAGVPVNIGTATGSGQARLDEASRDAVAKSRFAEGDARERCTLPFVQWPRPPVEAPESPDLDALRPAGATCGKVKWAIPPRGSYPTAFQKRAIEGWAIVRFDLSAAGQPAKAEVVASAPAAAFGTQAQIAIWSARAERAAAPQTGCVERVRFKMPA